MSSTRCQVCKGVLFTADDDPLDHYLARLGGWPNDQPPIAVCLGSWRSLWRRKWYHQVCCGIYGDKANLAGQWFVFGLTPPADRGSSRDGGARPKLVIAKISKVRYMPGFFEKAGWDFGTDQDGREWKSFDRFDEDFEDAECDICGAEMVASGWFCRETQQTVCDDHVEVDWKGYGDYKGEK